MQGSDNKRTILGTTQEAVFPSTDQIKKETEDKVSEWDLVRNRSELRRGECGCGRQGGKRGGGKGGEDDGATERCVS